MFRLSLGAAALLALTALLAPAHDDKDRAIPFEGRWKLTFVQEDHAVSCVIVRLYGTFGDPRGKVVATLPKFEGAKVRDLKVDANSVHFRLARDDGDLHVAAYAPK